jgi:hypothetical protein
MTGRDRTVIVGILVVLILGASWLLVVSPERKEAAALGTQVGAATAALATAEGQVASARGAQAQYATAYASIVSLGKAVPPSAEVPALIYQLEHVTHQKNVEFTSISTGGGASSSAVAAAPGAAPTGFSQMPFTFVFDGTFSDLSHLFEELDHATTRTPKGALVVNGRLLTIQSVKLNPSASGAEAKSKGGEEALTGSITATAYVLPAAQGLTAGATTGAPAGSTTTPAATPATTAATPSTASSATPPAVARVTP